MSDNNSSEQQKTQKKNNSQSWFNIAIAVAAIALLGNMIINNMATFLNIMKVVLGFGFVVMIHEFGHFIVAKMSGIKVEAFSIGFPPTLIGIQKTEKGTRFRILPCLTPKKTDDKNKSDDAATKQTEDTDERMCYYVGSKNSKPSDTEYRIGLIPAGGFVAMLGQSDSGPVEHSDDPRSYANKPIHKRIAVVAAGVIFNAISAVFIFMTVFSIGLDLPPAVVGDVLRNSPAEKAGIVPGDRIIEVDGETFVDFTSIPMAAALSDKGEPVKLLVEHEDGTTEEMSVIAEEPKNMPMHIRKIGIAQPTTNYIPGADQFATQEEIEILEESTGFKPGDVVTAVNSVSVENGWQMNAQIKKCVKPAATVTVKRADSSVTDIEVPLFVMPNVYNFETSYDLTNYYSLIPRIKINEVHDRTTPKSWKEEVVNFWRKTILRQQQALEEKSPLKEGDIIVKIGDTANPTYPQLRDVTTAHDNKPMPMTVLRKDESGKLAEVEVTVTPLKEITRSGDGPVNIGIAPELDIEHAVIAGIAGVAQGNTAIPVPGGATITKINDTNIKNFFDVVAMLNKNQGKEVKLAYSLNGKSETVQFVVPSGDGHVLAESQIAVYIPFDNLKEIYKASSPVEAIGMGLKKTSMFITQTLLTLKGLATRSVSPTSLSGPLGIVTTSYSIAKQSNMYYLYFLGLISSCIAVMNLLPLPIVDGGVIVLLIIEKIKGSPISIKIQEVISYAGLAMILALFAWLFWNDLLNMILN